MINNSFQIYLNEKSNDIPPILEEATRTFKLSFPNNNYILYNFESLDELIKNKIGKDAHNAFLKLLPFAYKADLAKYCISYLYGGWYADISIKFLKGVNLNNVDFLGFQDLGDGTFKPYTLPYSIQSSLFYSEPKNKILEKAIEIVIENCKYENYGVSPICPTGPGVLGRSFAKFGQKASQIIGTFTTLTPNHEYKNRSYILPDGQILALHKNAWLKDAQPGDISLFSQKGTNNYIEMYRQKNIYQKEVFYL